MKWERGWDRDGESDWEFKPCLPKLLVLLSSRKNKFRRKPKALAEDSRNDVENFEIMTTPINPNKALWEKGDFYNG